MKTMHLKAAFVVLFVLYNENAKASWFDEQSINNTIIIERRETIIKFSLTEYILFLKAVPGVAQELNKGIVSRSENEISIDVDKISEKRVKELSQELYSEIRRRAPYEMHGTGFVVYPYETFKGPIVVTCKHVLQRPVVFLTVRGDSSFLAYAAMRRLDSITLGETEWVIDGNKLRCRFETSQDGQIKYVAHPTLDIAAFRADILTSTKKGDNWIKVSNVLTIPKSQMGYRRNVFLGDEVYFTGFPLGIGYEEMSPLIRSGSIAWAPVNVPLFLLDTLSFGGNSGSPVFKKILLGTKPGYLEWDNPLLIGMVSGHFEANNQNWGLANCVWVDDIVNVLQKLGWSR